MDEHELGTIRKNIDALNFEILDVLNRRAALVERIAAIKIEKGIQTYDPARESEMIARILKANKGPFSDGVIKKLFKEIFSASLFLMDKEHRETLLVSRKHKSEDTVVRLGEDCVIGAGSPVIMAGPCSVESPDQMDRIARGLKELGVKVVRAGAYKPRSSPYSFQGLREKGLEILGQVAKTYGFYVVTELLDARDLEKVCQTADILQIGARNMFNYELLKEVGRCKKPVLLKRSFSATMEEFLFSAEYIVGQGNTDVILCERGLRTFEKWTRNTLDISAIPILDMESHLPILVDISHSTGRRDIVLPIARAALAAGADGLMVEVHYDPDVALSDNEQQLNLQQFRELLEGLQDIMHPHRVQEGA